MLLNLLKKKQQRNNDKLNDNLYKVVLRYKDSSKTNLTEYRYSKCASSKSGKNFNFDLVCDWKEK